MSDFVLITPAHNEEAYLAETILSVARQQRLPLRWVLVDDASTDGTWDIMRRYAAVYPFIDAISLKRPAGRHFGNKATAFSAGAAAVQSLAFDFIGNLDADIALEPDYFRRILREFDRAPSLGIAGGMVHSCLNGRFVSQEVALDSVAGAVQLFRRLCFEQVGGYVPLPHGGIDAAAEIKARMNGWTVRTVSEARVLERRRTGSANLAPLASKLEEGRRFHSLGYSFSFLAARCLFRLMTPPILLGSGAALLGYLQCAVERRPVALPPEVVSFLRFEQRAKLRRTLGGILNWRWRRIQTATH